MDRRLSLPVCVAALLAAGCLKESDYPSLDVRPIEKVPVADEPSGAPAAVNEAPLPPDLQAAVAAADSAAAGFSADLAAATRAVTAARGSALDGEAWVAAQQALSRAQARRAPVQSALAELDVAMTDSQLPASSATTAAIERLTKLDAEQGAALETLAASLTGS